jgi:hypothetical protein
LVERINAANTASLCHPPRACVNPHILAVEKGYLVTTFSGNTSKHAEVRPEALREYLFELPMSAWPSGPSISISPADLVIDPDAVQKNVKEAQRICRSLRLNVKFIPGG